MEKSLKKIIFPDLPKEGYFPDTGENMLPVEIMMKIKKIAIMDTVMAGSLTKFPKAYWEVDMDST